MTARLPRITIVTPCFNQSRFIGQTIESILDQRYPDLEYIVMDGGSTDGSVEIIRKYADRLAHWESKPDGGQYAAVNHGFARSTGEIMAWLNADDLYLSNSLLKVGDVFASLPDARWVTALDQSVIDWHSFVYFIKKVPGFSRAAFFDGQYLVPVNGTPGFCSIQQESTFWRRSLWEQAGGSLDLRYGLAGDFDLWARFFERADVVGVPGTLGAFRGREGQRSEDLSEYRRQSEQSLREARTRVGWKPTLGRSAWLAMPAKLRNRTNHRFRYTGVRTRRVNGGSAKATWELERFRFPG